MALTVADRAVHPLTADQVLRMVEAGILDEDEPVELLDGVLTVVSAKTYGHEEIKRRLNRWIDPTGNAHRYDVLIECPLHVPDITSLPEPDFMVIAHDPARDDHPRTALLVVEVAVSSRVADMVRKPGLYAAAGVADYWVADVTARELVVHTQPQADGYATVRRLASGALAPGRLGVEPLDVAGLFAGL